MNTQKTKLGICPKCGMPAHFRDYLPPRGCELTCSGCSKSVEKCDCKHKKIK